MMVPAHDNWLRFEGVQESVLQSERFSMLIG